VIVVGRSFPAHRAVLKEIRAFIRAQADEHSFDDDAETLALAVTEACANAMIHASCTQIGVTWSSTSDRVQIEVVDDGIFRRRVPVPEFDGEGHRGIPLMMALLDQVSISGGTQSRPGTKVTLVKFRESDRGVPQKI
jgi:anti-sigma regulatory factor (Ser/Thr protein kinase)